MIGICALGVQPGWESQWHWSFYSCSNQEFLLSRAWQSWVAVGAAPSPPSIPAAWGLNSKVKFPGVLWALRCLGYVGIHTHKQFRMNVSYGIWDILWAGRGRSCPGVCLESSEVLCMNLSLLRLGKWRILKLQFTKTSLVAFMGKTEFIQVHRMTKLLEKSSEMKLHYCE